MTNRSIRSVLHSLHATQIDAYLLNRSWKRESKPRATQQRFSLPTEDADGEYSLRYWPDPKTTNYIDTIYKLVYYLSCIEDREPMAVAQEILEYPIESTGWTKICIESIITQELQQATSPERVQSVLEAMAGKIAQAEFICTALGNNAGNEDDLALTKLALVLVPLAKIAAEITDRETARTILCNSLATAIAVEISGEQPREQYFATFFSDSEHAPQQALAVLKELSQ